MRKFKNGFYVLIVVFLLFEFSYRFYIIDFYKVSWINLNTEEELKKDKVDLMVFGDSFSTFPEGYVSLLRKEFSSKVILNSAVSGIGLNQINIISSKRIQKKKPKKILCQVYIGNDLIDLKHLTNWTELSIKRNLYWKMSDYFLSIPYINYRLSFFNSVEKENHPIFNPNFYVAGYNARSKLYFRADSSYLDKTINLTGDFLSRYEIWKKRLNLFVKQVPSDIEIIIVFIPHCSQLNSYYKENMIALGGVFTSDYMINNYEFYKRAQKEFSNIENITFLNPLEFFKQKDNESNRLYFANDPHLNSKGQQELFNFLKNKIF